MKKTMTLIAVAGLVLALAPAAQAANVTWLEPISVFTNGDATVINTGTLITAESYGNGTLGAGDHTVNGVLFTGVEYRSNFTKASAGAMGQDWSYIDWGTDLSTAFSGLLDGISLMKNAPLNPTTITLGGLESGKSYIAQFFIGDLREADDDGNPNGRYIDGNFTITGGASTSSAAWIMPIHSFVGTWVADGPSQDFTITNSGGAQALQAILNAVQVREVPEPATMSLLAIGGLGVLLKRRRRRA